MLTSCLNMLNLARVALPTYVGDHTKHKRKPVTLCPYSCSQFVCLLLTKICIKDSYPWRTEEWRQRIKDNYCCPWNTIERLPAMTYRSMTTAHETDERLLPMAYRSMTAGYKTKTTNTPKMCEMWAAAQPFWNRETWVIAVPEEHHRAVCESNLLTSGEMI